MLVISDRIFIGFTWSGSGVNWRNYQKKLCKNYSNPFWKSSKNQGSDYYFLRGTHEAMPEKSGEEFDKQFFEKLLIDSIEG